MLGFMADLSPQLLKTVRAITSNLRKVNKTPSQERTCLTAFLASQLSKQHSLECLAPKDL